MPDCAQITINYQISGDPAAFMYANPIGLYNGYESYEVPFYIGTSSIRYIYFVGGTWYFSGLIGETDLSACIATAIDTDGTPPVGLWTLQADGEKFDFIDFVGCNSECPCITINVNYEGGSELISLTSSGIYNDYNFYSFNVLGTDFYLWYTGDKWQISENLGVGPYFGTGFETINFCPEGEFRGSGFYDGWTVTRAECSGCTPLQDRTKGEYNSIKLPDVFEEECRGFFRCCCEYNVLADGSSDTWRNDITSAWIKLSGPLDTATAILYKNGVPASYTAAPVSFPNEPNAFYWTFQWASVLAADGPGKYELIISYDISGITSVFTWGIYNLKAYTVTTANKTARLKAIFSGYHAIEGIDFTNSNVTDTIRFYGFIGNRQPNTEIDNLIYQNREVKRVVRENLNTYEIITDPTCDDHIKKLTDLYLLSENELFISDYNAHNHSYRYQDTPVILEESAEITYYELSREASLKCKVSDKFKNQKTYYNG